MCQRLAVTATVLLALVLMIHFWLQFLVIFVMYALLNHMESTLKEACHCLMNQQPVSVSLATFMHLYSFTGFFCALICTFVLFRSLDEPFSFVNAVVSACLVSLFVFLVFASMKHTAVLFKFFRLYDIENGAVSLLSLICVIFRYISVTPIWLCFLGDSSLRKFPDKFTSLCHIYLLIKLGGLWILCVDFSNMCTRFFKAVLLRAPAGALCEGCHDGVTKAELSTQCGHSFCVKCIDKGRAVSAACPICGSPIPRKWSTEYHVSLYVMLCIL